jgi:hypothetical protein
LCVLLEKELCTCREVFERISSLEQERIMTMQCSNAWKKRKQYFPALTNVQVAATCACNGALQILTMVSCNLQHLVEALARH